MTFLFQKKFYHLSGEFFPHNSEDLCLPEYSLKRC